MSDLKVWLGSLSDLSKDPRPIRANLSLKKLGSNTEDLLVRDELMAQPSKLSVWFRMIYWGTIFHIGVSRNRAIRNFLNARMRRPIILKQTLAKEDLILLFDIDLLPFTSHHFPTNSVALDFREIYTEQFATDLKFRMFLKPIRKYILEHYAPQIKMGYTVSRGLVKFYRDEYRLDLALVRSYPLYDDNETTASSNDIIKIVYLGVAHPLRGLEQSIETIMTSRTDVEFHLYLVGDQNYIDSIKSSTGKTTRLFIHPPVEFQDIHATLSNYDLGWCYFNSESKNIRNCLPNKFFDYVQAGLGVICGPNLDMLEESKNWNFGFFAEDYSQQALTRLLVSLSHDSIEQAKRNARLAKQELTWQEEEEKLLHLLRMAIEK
jgi:hypothetical protein